MQAGGPWGAAPHGCASLDGAGREPVCAPWAGLFLLGVSQPTAHVLFLLGVTQVEQPIKTTRKKKKAIGSQLRAPLLSGGVGTLCSPAQEMAGCWLLAFCCLVASLLPAALSANRGEGEASGRSAVPAFVLTCDPVGGFACSPAPVPESAGNWEPPGCCSTLLGCSPLPPLGLKLDLWALLLTFPPGLNTV